MIRFILLNISIGLLIATPAVAADISTFQELPFLNNAGELTTEDYVNVLYRIIISVAAITVVIRLIWAGVGIMFSESVSRRSKAREDFQNALLGLLIILGAVTILQTINPRITETNILGRLESTVPTQGNQGPISGSVPANIPTNSGATSCPAGEVLHRTQVGNTVRGTCVPSADTLNQGRSGDSLSGISSGTMSQIYTWVRDQGLYSGVNTQDAFLAWENRCATLGGQVTSNTDATSGSPRYRCVYP